MVITPACEEPPNSFSLQIPDRVQLSLKFDPQYLQADLQKLQSSHWINHFVIQNYEGSWSVIPLRGARGASHPVQMIYADPTCKEFTDTPFLKHLPYFRHLLNTLNCPLQCVRLMKLSPVSRIKEHRDHDLAAENGLARLHIPVVTHEEVDFRLNGSPVVMKAGECWYLRLSDPHSVVNNGPSERVHLVIDTEINAWLAELLQCSVHQKAVDSIPYTRIGT